MYQMLNFSGYLPSKEEERMTEEKEQLELRESRKSMNMNVNVDDYIIGKKEELNNSKEEMSDLPNKKKQQSNNDAFEI
jgi:Ser-tRNA(Ala) deacylase AlaX